MFNVESVVGWAKRMFIRFKSVARKKLIELFLVFLFGCAAWLLSGPGWRTKDWQATLPTAGAKFGDPERFVWAPYWLSPTKGGMTVHGLPDGDVKLRFGTFSGCCCLFNGSCESGDVFCGELEVGGGSFEVEFKDHNFIRILMLTRAGSFDREFWMRFPAADRRDAAGKLPFDARMAALK